MASGQITGREHSPSLQQKIGLMICWACPPPHQNKTQFPLQSVSPIRKLPQASYPSPLEGRQTENHNHRKLTNLITRMTALSNSVKLWVMPCRPSQHGCVMVESSDKTWSTGEGNGKPLQYSCLENPMKSMKRQKYRTLKEELPNILLEISGEITPEKMKRRSQSKNNTQLWMWLVIKQGPMLKRAILHKSMEC